MVLRSDVDVISDTRNLFASRTSCIDCWLGSRLGVAGVGRSLRRGSTLGLVSETQEIWRGDSSEEPTCGCCSSTTALFDLRRLVRTQERSGSGEPYADLVSLLLVVTMMMVKEKSSCSNNIGKEWGWG